MMSNTLSKYSPLCRKGDEVLYFFGLIEFVLGLCSAVGCTLPFLDIDMDTKSVRHLKMTNGQET